MNERVNNCVIPTDRYLDIEEHVWAKVDDGEVTVGMTDVAQSLAKKFLHVHVRGEGTAVEKGDSVATVESGKFVGPVKTPVGGEIVAVNDAVASNAELINQSPYEDGWIARIDPSDLEGDLDGALIGEAAVEAYREAIEAEDRLDECWHAEGSDVA